MTDPDADFRSLVVHCRRAPFDVYIGPGSSWASPLIPGKNETPEEITAQFSSYLLRQSRLCAWLPQLRSRVLGCWCAPQACHGWMLARLANGPVLRVGSGSGDAAAVRSETGRLLACLECRNPDRPVPQPFGTQEERAAWAAAHLRMTGHDSWLTMKEEE